MSASIMHFFSSSLDSFSYSVLLPRPHPISLWSLCTRISMIYELQYGFQSCPSLNQIIKIIGYIIAMPLTTERLNPLAVL